MNHPAGGLGGFELETRKLNSSKGSKDSPGANGHDNGFHFNGNGNGNGFNGNGHNGNGHNGNGNGSHGSGALMTKPPSVIGFSANVGADPFEFIGDFVYQEMRRDEKPDLIFEIVKRCVKTYQKNRQSYPKRVICYRNGCGEGSFPMVLKFEVPLIKHALRQINCQANVTVIVANKKQGVRFFPGKVDSLAKSPLQNVQPGTVTDQFVVHSKFCEFFLTAHRALQGTARTPKYTVLYDDANLTMDQLEGITYHLSFGHQIVFMPTSLPSPVYIAEAYAKRGRNLYNSHVDAMNAVTQERSATANLTYRDVQDALTFRSVENLATKRVNA